jgi:pyruvate/2-oxoacid:ferredoxin oxidoreductase beta subunit
MAKVKKAAEAKGPAYIHVYSVCPTGWRSAPNLSVEIGKLAVETGVFPLWELEGGVYKLNVSPAKLKPVSELFKPQGRFRHLTPSDIAEAQALVDKNWAALQRKVAASKPAA